MSLLVTTDRGFSLRISTLTHTLLINFERGADADMRPRQTTVELANGTHND
jgi:hypothetical protein